MLKRLARLLITDVALLKSDGITAQVRFNGGTTHTLHLALPQSAWQMRKTPSALVAQIDRLLDDHTDGEVARRLNAQGMHSGDGHAFTLSIVRHIRLAYHLRSRYERLRARGMLTLDEIAERLDVRPATIKIWRRAGLLHAHRSDDRGQCLFEHPGVEAPIKHRHQGKMRALAAVSRASSHTPD
jgi:MerR-like DNA binding protein